MVYLSGEGFKAAPRSFTESRMLRLVGSDFLRSIATDAVRTDHAAESVGQTAEGEALVELTLELSEPFGLADHASLLWQRHDRSPYDPRT
ncbi:MAG TPA: hypothetical protein VF612_06060 [Jatrophihabitans sp.]|jgi:hypothetical protein|uniref:hypothetical protein n=1 Tax=Jatrophihabitans sp. TaxID=1932789 RepID=UPI002EF3019E